ncbi:hypothetical protein IJ00_14100 [Calothrix sp. 336/3]|nr:hypothetical protein IJ00_14100 [Calothrix sp. 336/3]
MQMTGRSKVEFIPQITVNYRFQVFYHIWFAIRDKLRFLRFCQEQYRGTQKAEKLVIVHLLVQNHANQKTEKP